MSLISTFSTTPYQNTVSTDLREISSHPVRLSHTSRIPVLHKDSQHSENTTRYSCVGLVAYTVFCVGYLEWCCGSGPNGPEVTNKANVVHGTKTAKAAKTSPVVTMHDGSNHKRTNMEIKFCRVKDVQLIMQACRVFFKQTSSVHIGVEFPRGNHPLTGSVCL